MITSCSNDNKFAKDLGNSMIILMDSGGSLGGMGRRDECGARSPASPGSEEVGDEVLHADGRTHKMLQTMYVAGRGQGWSGARSTTTRTTPPLERSNDRPRGRRKQRGIMTHDISRECFYAPSAKAQFVRLPREDEEAREGDVGRVPIRDEGCGAGGGGRGSSKEGSAWPGPFSRIHHFKALFGRLTLLTPLPQIVKNSCPGSNTIVYNICLLLAHVASSAPGFLTNTFLHETGGYSKHRGCL